MTSSIEKEGRARISFAVALGLLLIGLAISAFASLPDNVFEQPVAGSPQSIVQLLVPQGWAFFTRDPEGANVVPFRPDAQGRWVRADTLPQASLVNLYGLSRNQRAEGTELGIIAASIPRFTPCDDYLSACLELPAKTRIDVRNETSTHFFCGRIRLVNQEPVKFEYRDEVPEMIRVVSFADLLISCPRS